MSKGKVHRRVLNDEQLEWLRRWFPVTENCRLAKAMKISLYKLREFARENGLVKSEAGLKAIRRRQNAKMVKTNEKNGCYDRKRGHPVSEATREGNLRRWEEERIGLRENALLKMRRENPEKYIESMKKRSQESKDAIRKEKLRILYGLERKTRLKAVVMTPYTRSQLQHRASALRRGYLLDEDFREGQPGRYVIYYDDETERSEIFERNCIKDGFRFERDE